MMFIVTDEYGNMNEGFPKYYSDGNRHAGANTIVAKNGGLSGFLLCGYSRAPDGDEDLYMVRTDREGDTLWTRRYGSAENEAILHAIEGITYEYVAVGYQEEEGKKGILVMAFEQEGDIVPLTLHIKPYNSEDATANYILNTGESYLCISSYKKVFGEGKDILILSFDDELSPILKPLNSSYDEYGTCVVRDTVENRFLLLGNRITAQTGRSEILLHSFELDAQTDPPTPKAIKPLASEPEFDTDLHAERLVRTGAGRFVIVGTRTYNGDQDIFLQFLKNYQIAERIVFGSTGNQTGVDICQPEEGSLILLGSNAFEGNSMISLIKTDDSGSL